MKTPSQLLALLALGLAAAPVRADLPQTGLDSTAANFFESGANACADAPNGAQCLPDVAHARVFFVKQGQQPCVILKDSFGKSDCVSTDKTDDRVIKEYQAFLTAQNDVQVVTGNGVALVPAASGAGGMFHSLSLAQPGAGPTNLAGKSTTPGAPQNPTAPAVVALSIPGASVPPQPDAPSAPGSNPAALGGGLGQWMASVGGLTSGAPSGQAAGLTPGAAGSGATTDVTPELADGSAIQNTGDIALTHTGTIRAAARQKKTLTQGSAVLTSGSTDPNAGVDGMTPAPGGMGITPNAAH
jgi:hypothetical protein